MSSVCYWFSGTGNSLYTAQRAAEVIEGMRLVPITRSLADNPPRLEGDVVGLVFPVYAYGPPAIIRRFLGNAEIGEVGYLFSALTHGGGPANAALKLNEITDLKGIAVDATFLIRMPSNYVTGSNPITGAKLKSVLATSEDQLEAMCALLKSRTSFSSKSGGIGGRLKSWAIHPLFMRGLKHVDRKFTIDPGCTGCGICTKVCPMENITLDDNKRPVWHGACEYCLGCINACPERAIQTGSLTRRRGRYRHPEIPIKRLMTRK